MQPVFHFRTDSVSNLLNVLLRDDSDQSKVLLRLLKIILKCKNPNDILWNLSTKTNTQGTVIKTCPPQTNNPKPDTNTHETKQEEMETNNTDASDQNLHDNHAVTIQELESAFEDKSAIMHRDEQSISRCLYYYDSMHTMSYFK